MHEFAIVQGILDAVEQTAAEHAGASVSRIDVRVGVLRQIERVLLREAFEMLRPGTCAENAELVVEAEGLEVHCADCGSDGRVDQIEFACPRCGAPNVRLSGGDALCVTSIRLEVPDGDCCPAEPSPIP